MFTNHVFSILSLCLSPSFPAVIRISPNLPPIISVYLECVPAWLTYPKLIKQKPHLITTIQSVLKLSSAWLHTRHPYPNFSHQPCLLKRNQSLPFNFTHPDLPLFIVIWKREPLGAILGDACPVFFCMRQMWQLGGIHRLVDSFYLIILRLLPSLQ